VAGRRDRPRGRRDLPGGDERRVPHPPPPVPPAGPKTAGDHPVVRTGHPAESTVRSGSVAPAPVATLQPASTGEEAGTMRAIAAASRAPFVAMLLFALSAGIPAGAAGAKANPKAAKTPQTPQTEEEEPGHPAIPEPPEPPMPPDL